LASIPTYRGWSPAREQGVPKLALRRVTSVLCSAPRLRFHLHMKTHFLFEIAIEPPAPDHE